MHPLLAFDCLRSASGLILVLFKLLHNVKFCTKRILLFLEFHPILWTSVLEYTENLVLHGNILSLIPVGATDARTLFVEIFARTNFRALRAPSDFQISKT